MNTAPKVDKRHRIDAEEWATSGQWVHVKSSNVAAIRYYERHKALFVQFLPDKRGKQGEYVYLNVEPIVAKEMFVCDSMGQFVHYRLKGRYPFAKIT